MGGLVAVNRAANGVHFGVYDGNGNLTGLVKAADGSVSARYDSGPFGEPLRASGTAIAAENPFRFSTKRTDPVTDLVHYEYRVYSPVTGRWPNRDPLGELGGANLYSFIHNNPVGRFDPFGLKDYKVGTADPTITPDAGAGTWDSEEWTWSNVGLKRLIVNNIEIVSVGCPMR